MSKQLYEEALADVKKLKEVAEDNAKRAILDAVTPRIRDLIEHQLLGHDHEEVADPEDQMLMDEFPEEETSGEIPVNVAAGTGDTVTAASAMSLPDEEGKVTLDLDVLRIDGSPEEEYELGAESAQSLGMLNKNPVATFEAKLSSLDKRVKLFAAAGPLVKESKGYSEQISLILSEVEDTYQHLQEDMQDAPKKNVYESVLEGHYSNLSTIKQLTEQKMKKNKKLSEGDVTLKLTGLPDELDLDSVGVDLITGDEEGEEGDAGGEDLDLDGGDEGGGDDLDLDLDGGGDEDKDKMESVKLSDDTIVEIDENMLRREIGRMKALREADATTVTGGGNGAGDVADGWADEDEGDAFLKGEVTTESDGDTDEDKDVVDEADGMDGTLEMDEVDQAADKPEYGSDERDDTDKQGRSPGMEETIKRRLAAEVRLQTEAKKKAQTAKQKKAEADKKDKAAKKVQEKQAAKKQAKKMQEAYVYFARKFNESVTRANKLKGMLAEVTSRKGTPKNGGSTGSADETNSLRTKLAETNLFNAKLLYTNKLLQNESLTKRQKAEVIERLDEARTEREVKLVYESLTKTLQGTSGRKLTESTDRGVMGSSSRPARQASAVINEGFEADRWARLAGITK